MSPRTEQVSIYLRYISGGVTKETFIGYSLRPSKTVTALVHYYFFSLAGPRDKQVVFAIRAKLGLTPQMDVRPYAYGCRHRSVKSTAVSNKTFLFQLTNVAHSYGIVNRYRWTSEETTCNFNSYDTVKKYRLYSAFLFRIA